MRKIFIVPLLLISCVVVAQVNKPSSLSIIPKPVSVVEKKSRPYLLSDQVEIIAAGAEQKNVAQFLVDFFKTDIGLKRKATIVEKTASKKASVITLHRITPDTLLPEGYYTLSIRADGIVITAPNDAGLFYGAQTLIQMLSASNKQLPAVDITDYPRFAYRGLHLDVGRHMFPVDFIKKYIDLMAKHKFNRFHWHLTEDQGWRIEIKKYPKLQEIAAYRKETVIGHAGSRTRQGRTYDGQRYGGYYTQEEVKEVVAYATQRYVTVIPEIELPGHAQAALSAYPNLGCSGGPYEAATTWGVFEDVFCAGKEETFTFLQDVFDEVLPLFPSEYIHIGGDECPKTQWEKCPHCQKRKNDLNLKDEHELQSYFIQRIEKYLNGKGRRIIGWDEILEGGLAPNATVMSWRGEEGGVAAAKQNHDVIMTPGAWCYFDKYQDTTNHSKNEPLAIGGFLPVRKVYGYEPVPPQLNTAEAQHVLGAQANLWTEYIKTSDHVEYMIYPRAVAMSEVLWSPKDSRDYADFLKRLAPHLKLLDAWKVHYAKHVEKELK